MASYSPAFLIISILSAIAAACLLPFEIVFPAAQVLSLIFINFLKLVSLPIIFFSIVSTFSSMENLQEVKWLTKRVLLYAWVTTILAAAVALLFFIAIDPVGPIQEKGILNLPLKQNGSSWIDYIGHIVPSSFIRPFVENNAVAVVFLALIFSVAILKLPSQQRKILQPIFSSFFAVFMQITALIIKFMPIGIWAFIVLFIHDLQSGLEIEPLIWYLVCVIGANLVQALAILPLFLLLKGINPWSMAQKMFPALSLAFFSKSSSATLPLTIECCEKGCHVSPKIARFTLPLCATVNMNACAAFILTTVLFVSSKEGISFSAVELILWIFLATIAAFGNAAVPMGCYFLATAFLASMDVPLQMMGAILPFYALLDMLETAINVWSDACVALAVQKDEQNEMKRS